MLLQYSPLLAASYYGHVEAVKRLLVQKGVDVKLQDYEFEKDYNPLKCNCLVFAILNGHRLVCDSILYGTAQAQRHK